MRESMSFISMIHPPPSPLFDHTHDFREALAKLERASTQIDLLQYEESFPKNNFLEVREATLALLNKMLVFLDYILELKHLSMEAPPSIQLENEKMAAFDYTGENFKTFIDVSNIVKHKLMDKVRALQLITFDAKNKDEVIELLSSCLRSISNYKNTSEGCLFDHENFRKTDSYKKRLQESIGIRRIYAKFRMRLGLLEEGVPDLHRRLFSLGNLLAMVVGHRLFLRFRPGDRMLFRQLQLRIIEWIKHTPDDGAVGLHLWQDILGAAQFLMEINNRCILFENDRDCVIALKKLIAKLPADDVLEGKPLQKSQELLGRSLDLDVLLQGDQPVRVGELEEILDFLGERFVREVEDSKTT